MDALPSLLAAFASAFSQQDRLFRLHFSDTTLDTELLPHTLRGEEHLSEPYRFVLECLGNDVSIALKSLLGQGVDIVVHGPHERTLSGIVTQARQLGSDGGFARYGLTVEPGLALLKYRRNSRVFQDKSVVDIVSRVLDEHIAANPVFAQHFRFRDALTQMYPARSFCQQYRESDFAFISRLLREEGISYYFDGDHGDQIGLHTLVLIDSGSALNAAPQATIRFHRADATEADDTLTHWEAHRQMHSGATALASFDYKGVYTQHGADSSTIDHGDAGNGLNTTLEDYDPQSLYCAGDDSELGRYARLRQQAADLAAKQFIGEGVVRGLGVGQWFTLDDHPVHEADDEMDRQFLVLSQTLHARNNLPDGLSSPSPCGSTRKGYMEGVGVRAIEPGYQHQFTAARTSIPLVPDYAHTGHAKPTARGIQTATVVGPAGEEIFTDALGRIKIQFHWARPQDHDPARHGAGANRDDHSSCWVRVGYPSAGAGFGQQFIPRVGQEVVVTFLDNDIDRPLVTAVIHNGQQTPPNFSGAGSLPINKTLSGIKTQEYKGGGYNELLFDDSTGAIRTKLSSEHGSTQLNQGFLIHPRSEGKSEQRGEGFELRTDKAGAIRAAQGLLISTEAQPEARGNQLDRDTALAVLDAAAQQADRLGDAAQSAHADPPEAGNGYQRVHAALRNLERNTNTEALTPAPSPGGRGEVATGGQASQQPLLAVSGQAGISITTPQVLTMTAGTHLDHIVAGDTHQTTGRRWIANAVESISLFVAGKARQAIQLIAAKGNLQMQAQSADIEIDGDQSLMITACRETITASAQTEITLTCGGAQIRLSGGNIEVIAPGNISLKGARQGAAGPVSMHVNMPVMPNVEFAYPPAKPTYSTALAFPENCEPWLPRQFARSSIVRDKSAPLTWIGRAADGVHSGSVFTAMSTDLDHWLAGGEGWQIEESIEQLVNDNEDDADAYNEQL